MRKLITLLLVFTFAIMVTSCGRKTPVKPPAPSETLTGVTPVLDL